MLNLVKMPLVVCVCWFALASSAQELYVAVASNFAKPIQAIGTQFTQETHIKVRYALAASGALYAQIKAGAPFDIFLSADARTPQLLSQEGLAVPSSQITYAKGKLVLWSKDTRLIDKNAEVLKKASFKRIALANPKLAPYGKAAQEALFRLGLYDALKPKIILTENISQVFQYVSTQNVELGFIAYSQLPELGEDALAVKGSYWIVPSSLYPPIEQDAIVLNKGSTNPAAAQFMQFLKRQDIKSMIAAQGYDI